MSNAGHEFELAKLRESLTEPEAKLVEALKSEGCPEGAASLLAAIQTAIVNVGQRLIRLEEHHRSEMKPSTCFLYSGGITRGRCETCGVFEQDHR